MIFQVLEITAPVFVLATIGFVGAVLGMAAILCLILVAVLIAMPAGLPKGRKGVKFTEVFSKSSNVNWLSAARVFLFGARDVWFVVGLPVFLYGGLKWSFEQVGGFLAIWVIGYGLVQSLAPTVLRQFGSGRPPQAGTIRFWTSFLTAIPAAIALLLVCDGPECTSGR